MLIAGRTKVLGIFGDPVEHSLSPLMHNAAIEQLGLDMVYVPWKVPPSMLKEAIEGVRAMGIRGVNLTIPHKERALEYLDELSTDAQMIGAVNTVVNDEGRLVGYNTDGRGLVFSLDDEHGFSPEKKRIILIGAGGAARGIAVALALGGAESIVIANRTAERAVAMSEEFGEKTGKTSFYGIPLHPESLADAFRGAHLLINTSSAGMNEKNDLALPLEALPHEAIVADIVYRPLLTGLLSDAQKLGLKTQNGLGMLASQGALSLQLWTGCPAPVNVMKRTLEDAAWR